MNIIGIQEAKYSEQTHTLIDFILLTDEGEVPFAYVPGEEDAITLYIDSHLGQLDIAPFTNLIGLEEFKELKIQEISNAFNDYISGRVSISLGWDMQFNLRDITMVDGAIRHIEMTGGTEGYLTDADNVNHYQLPITQMKQALLEMTGAYLNAHAHKQELRDMAVSATTHEEMDLIAW